MRKMCVRERGARDEKLGGDREREQVRRNREGERELGWRESEKERISIISNPSSQQEKLKFFCRKKGKAHLYFLLLLKT